MIASCPILKSGGIMNTHLKEIDYFNQNFDSTERELKEILDSNAIKIEINEGLEEALSAMQELENQLTEKESAKLIDLCKNTVIETITGQFGLAGLFVQTMDGGNVTTVHNFEKGIVATESDKQKYDAFKVNQEREWKEVRDEVGYDKPLPQKRKDTFQNQEIIIDAYTGKELPKDGRAHLDHIVSCKEIESSAANNLVMTPEQRAKMATDDQNLAFTEASANQSKGADKMEDWLKKEDKKTGQTKAEKYEINEEMALEKDKQARKYVKSEVTKAKAKKYCSELLLSGVKDAAKMAAYSALGIILREFTQTIFVEIHITLRNRGNESFSEIFHRFKSSASKKVVEIKSKWKDILVGSIESGITAFLSNLLVFVINLFATALKKIVSMIRAGFVSLVQALKIMVHPPVGMPREEVNYQALKILTAGLIGAASLGLSAAIEKLLQSIPGLQPLMVFPIPFPFQTPRTVSEIVSVVLSALIGGLLTTVVLYFMDKCRENAKREKLHIQLVAQSGVVSQYKIAQTWVCLDDAYKLLQNEAADTAYYISSGQNAILESEESADKAISDLNDANKRLEVVINKFK